MVLLLYLFRIWIFCSFFFLTVNFYISSLKKVNNYEYFIGNAKRFSKLMFFTMDCPKALLNACIISFIFSAFRLDYSAHYDKYDLEKFDPLGKEYIYFQKFLEIFFIIFLKKFSKQILVQISCMDHNPIFHPGNSNLQ